MRLFQFLIVTLYLHMHNKPYIHLIRREKWSHTDRNTQTHALLKKHAGAHIPEERVD
jgi:hypothetical protein